MPEASCSPGPREARALPASGPLVRAGQLTPFVAASERLGIPTERYLDSARLSGSLLGAPERLIPRSQLWDFADRIAREEALPGFGLEAATTDPVATLGALGRRFLAAPTVWMGLARLVREFGRHSTHVCFRIDALPDGVRVTRHDVAYVRSGSDVVEQYTLMLLVSFVRHAAPEWRPERLWLRAPAPGWTTKHELLADSERIVGSPVTGIFVPREILARPMRRHPADVDAGVEDSFVDSLRQALRPLVGEISLDLDLAAEVVGARPRTLRLRLHEEGTSWRSLLDELRFDYTRARLEVAETKIGDIAFELGYADAAHFSRAFRRWTRVTPTEFRKRLRDPRATS